MLQKILAFFKKKPKEPVLEVEDTDLVSWINKRQETYLPQLKEELKQVNSRILSLADEAKQELIRFSEAKLQNPDIPEKEKNFMGGNRETYKKRTLQFLQSLQLLETIGRAEEYFANYALNLHQFHDTTQRPYYILNQFFKNEVGGVALKIKEIDEQVEKVKSIVEKSKYKEVLRLKEDLKVYNELRARKKSLEEEQKVLQEQEKDLESKKQNAENELGRLRETKEYDQVSALKEQAQSQIEKMKQKKLSFQELFARLEQGLKKYVRLSTHDEQVIIRYLRDPLGALQQDSSLRICLILQNMKLAIQRDDIQMKEDKKEKTIEDCDKVTKEYLHQFIEEFTELKKSEQEILKRVKTIPIMQDIAAVKKLLEEADTPLKDVQDRLARIKRDLSGISLEKKREDLNIKLSVWSNEKVKVVSEESV